MLTRKLSLTCRPALRTIAACSLTACALFASADIKTTSRMTMTFSMAGQKPKVLTMTSYYRQGQMRIDSSEGNSFIMDSKAHKTILLNPKTKTYTEMTIGSTTGQPPELVKKMHMTLSGHMRPTNEKKTIVGKPAKRYALDLALSANLPAMNGSPSPGSINGTMTGSFWTTTALKEKYSAEEMLGAYTQFIQSLSMYGDTTKLMKEFSSFKGFPLTTEMSMTITMVPAKGTPPPPAGTPMTFGMSMKTDLLTLTETTLSPDLFKIPAGYKKTEPHTRPTGPRA